MAQKECWLVAVPNSPSSSREDTFNRIASETEANGLSSTFPFPIPQLRIGTMDILMELSDELEKYDLSVESVIKRMERQMVDMVSEGVGGGNATISLTVNQEHPRDYISHWSWAKEKFNTDTSLKDLASKIFNDASRIDEDLRAKVSKMQETKTALASLRRRDQGSLQIRSLAPIVEVEHVIEGEYLTTLFIVVPLSKENEFLATYEILEAEYMTLGNPKDSDKSHVTSDEKTTKDDEEGKPLPFASCVVPRSAIRITADAEFALYRIVVFRKGEDSYKMAAKRAHFTVRDFKFDPESNFVQEEQLAKLEIEKEDLIPGFMTWCWSFYEELFLSWTHLKAIRVFVESVLRFGLPVDFCCVILFPCDRQEKKLRTTLADLFSYLIDGSYMDSATGDGDKSSSAGSAEVGVGLGFGGEYFPYVWVPFSLTTGI